MKGHCGIIGILNVTPDSFSDGGSFFDCQKAIAHAEKLFEEGADWVDIGGQSTRPDAPNISPQEEWKRVKPVLEALLPKYSEIISLDTLHPQTAEKFLHLGGQILNDVSGFQDPQMRELAPEFKKIIVNHFPGKNTEEVHKHSFLNSQEKVRDDLLARKEELVRAGVHPKSILLDPGIGFGKTPKLNWELLTFPQLLPDESIVIGHSRKRFLGEQRFEISRNLEAARVAIQSGVAFLRVHDVSAHRSLFGK